MKEITNEFRALVFAAYMPCKVVEKSRHATSGNEYAITGVSISEGMALFENADGDSDWWNVTDEYKMQLTDLSHITGAHKAELATVIFKGEATPLRLRMVSEWADKGQLVRADTIDKLRELGYITKFRGVDLVEAGVAIVEPKNEGI